MADFKQILPSEINQNTFNMIGKEWMLIAAEINGASNAMTASWGGFGVMWGKPVIFVVIRPQRYTKEFVDVSEKFSLTFFDEDYRKILNYFGTVSGRDEDKISKSGLTLLQAGQTPYFKEANTVIFCKNLFRQELKEKNFLDKNLVNLWYSKGDFHTLYIAEIEKVLIK